MASAARDKFGSDIGIGITGVAGPDEMDGKPAGTVHLGIDYKDVKRGRSLDFAPRRFEVKRRAVLQALAELRKLLIAK